jgi:hypothetical protein
MDTWRTAAHRRIVHARKIVEYQGSRMKVFKRDGKILRAIYAETVSHSGPKHELQPD